MNKGTPAEPLRTAAKQASFCLRSLLPDDPDAQMTVRMLDAALATKPAETPKRVERVDNIGNPGQGHPTESAGKSPEAAGEDPDAAYVSAFMDGLSWMQANPDSKPRDWLRAAADGVRRLTETQQSGHAARSDEQGCPACVTCGQPVEPPSVQPPSRDDRIARLMAEGMERPDAEKFADEIGAARASVQPPAPEPLTDARIEAGWKHAAAYDEDDRECIKTDVFNAFQAGIGWERRRASPSIAQRGAALTDEQIGLLIPAPHGWINGIDGSVHPLWVWRQFLAFADAIRAALSPERPEPPAPSTTGEKP